ncbi:DAK2 domain-containing protein [Actinoplanes sp. NPDC048796]|uniref:DAK2 domain-containing protein n=1 Tax=Actinoplanes sp. NPDC048796 TaxID=3155640 RepID=UPI0033E6B918
MLETLDAAAVRRWCGVGLRALRAHQREIDELNVYPVPDGDTGTNLVLTLTSAHEALEASEVPEATETARSAATPSGAPAPRTETPPGLTETPPGLTETAPTLTESPPALTESPSGLAETPTGLAETPTGLAETPTGLAGAMGGTPAALTGVVEGTPAGLGGTADSTPLARAMRLMARGALLGARGNSGVIVSQILRGMADSLAASAAVRGAELARALRSASEAAYAAVARPVEGTVLSVVAAAAEAAARIKSDDLLAVARAAARAASEALARTPQQLPALARAGVVDAGGRGLCLLLDALVEVLTPATAPHDDELAEPNTKPALTDSPSPSTGPSSSGAPSPGGGPSVGGGSSPGGGPSSSGAPSPGGGPSVGGGSAPGGGPSSSGGSLPGPRSVGTPGAGPGGSAFESDGALASDLTRQTGRAFSASSADSGRGAGAEGGFGFEVQYLLEAEPVAVDRLRRVLDALGDSLVVVGSGGDGSQTWNVHVHVGAAGIGPAVEAGVEAGRPHRISVTPLDDSGHGPGEAERPASGRGAVVVAAGDGLTSLFEAEGATVVGRNPSTREMLEAIAASGARCVVLLPNDANTHAVAVSAAREAESNGFRVSVVPTRSPVQALAALAVRDPGRSFADDVIAMAEAAGACRYGEVCTAQRDSLTVAGPCRAGDLLGLVDGEVHVIGDDVAAVGLQLLDRMLGGGGEMATLVLGADAPDGLEGKLRAYVTRAWPFVEVQSYAGGQPRYHLLVGVE